MGGYEAWLRGLGYDGLVALLGRRPDVLRTSRPIGSLRALATQLLRPESTRPALIAENGVTVGIAEALAALGKLVHRDEIADFVGEPERISADLVDAALDRL
jgi:hypothetical protein